VHGFVQYMIDQARKLGYQLTTLGDCLGDPPSNWYRDPVTGQPYNAANARPQAAVVPLSAALSGPSSASTTASVALAQFGAGTGPETGTLPTTRDSALATSTSKALAPARTGVARPETVLVVLISSLSVLLHQFAEA